MASSPQATEGPSQAPRNGREWQITVGAIVAAVVLAATIGGVVVTTIRDEHGRPPPRRIPVGVDIYRGLGTWVDVYDDREWRDPEGAVHRMATRGIRTLYLQTSNHGNAATIVYPDGVERFIDAAHAEGIAIVAWYLPGFDDVGRDLARVLAAVRVQTDAGHGFDSFALDIESPVVRNPERRTERLLALSMRIRRKVGESYPLGAIVPSPPAMAINPDYWPGFPYRELAGIYDVFLPMTYYTWRVSGPEAAHAYAREAVAIIRRETGSRDVPIHVIGGLAGEASPAETRAFVRAVLRERVVGASYYDFETTREPQWGTLREVEELVPPSPQPGPTLTPSVSAPPTSAPPS